MSIRRALFTPRGFLITGGIVLLVLGLVGFFMLNNPQNSFFWLTTGENVAHVGLGAVALAAALMPGLRSNMEPYHRWLVLLVGFLALFFAMYGFLLPGGSPSALNTFGLANLEFGDNLLHLVVAIWAFVAAYWTPDGVAKTA
jgi:hypothetical protein